MSEDDTQDNQGHEQDGLGHDEPGLELVPPPKPKRKTVSWKAEALKFQDMLDRTVELATSIEGRPVVFSDLPSDVQMWWRQRQVERERALKVARARGMAKLTKAQREALGLVE